MNVLITHVYSQKNRGDAAILDVLYHEILSIFPKANVTVMTMEATPHLSFAPQARVFPSFFYQAVYRATGWLRAITVFHVLTSTLLWSLVYRLTKIQLDVLLTANVRKLMPFYVHADLVIGVGGGYITAKPSLQSTIALILVLHDFFISTLLSKKVVLYSQSIGPFSTKFQKWLASFVLKRVDCIFVREDISMRLLQELGIDQQKYERAADAGFLFKGESEKLGRAYLQQSGVDTSKTLIGVTARQWLPDRQQKNYELALSQFIDSVTREKNTEVILIAQVSSTEHNDNDQLVNERIFSQLTHPKQVTMLDGTFSHREIKAVYANLDYLVGTRMHSCIFALTSFVPVLAIEYEHKTRGIMSDLHLSQWTLKIEEVRYANLTDLFEKLRQKRSEYLQTVNEYLPSYLVMAKHASVTMQRQLSVKGIE
jgi:colanic acid/amylovoran biosynthesis protein